jgi:uncharacterized protein YjiS (DUF1127 family)
VTRDWIGSNSLLALNASPNLLPRDASPRLPIRLLSQVAEWQERARSRYLLQQLDDRMLRDVGLSRSDVYRECAKHFWQR